MYVDLFWIQDEYRHAGLGSRLLKMMEEAALQKGICKFYLNTASFQALDFYKKNGYAVFAQLDIDTPKGKEIDYFLKKIINKA